MPDSDPPSKQLIFKSASHADALKRPNLQAVNRISDIHGQVNASQSAVSLHIKNSNR
jgi:hypothetical protein